MSAALSVFKLSVQSVSQLQQHKIEVFRNHRIFLSVNSCGKSFHIEARQSSARQCWLVLAYIASQYCTPYMIIQRIEIWRLKYQRGYFKSESQFN